MDLFDLEWKLHVSVISGSAKMTTEEKEHSPISYAYSRIKLYISVFIAAYLFIPAGIVVSWSSSALVLLKGRPYTVLQTTLLASLPNLAPGPLINMLGVNRIGRKYTIFVVWLTMMVGLTMNCIFEDIYALLLARFIAGWGMTATYQAVPIYISEICDDEVRGPLNSFTMVFVVIGGMIVVCVGPFVSFELFTVVLAAVSIVFGLFFWILPESPYYFVAKGKLQKARSTLTWLRKNASEKDVDNELSQIQFIIEEEKKNKVGIRKLCTSATVLKQFCLAWYLLLLEQMTGISAITSYALTIFEDAKLRFNPAYASIGLSLFSACVGIPMPLLLKKFGNKVLFLVAAFGCTLGHLLMALYFFLLQGNYDVSQISWLPIFSTCLLMTFFMDFSGIVWGVVIDFFAPSVKGYATGICGILSSLFSFLAVEIFGLSLDAYGYGATFLGFSIVLFVFTFGLFFIPNTTCMSLQEIQDYFEGNSQKIRKTRDLENS